jgi:hypothetical protein
MMNEFNKGIEYAFDYIEKNIKGYVVNGQLESAILKEDLKKIRKNISRKCDSCTKPCGTDWCSTKG